MRLFEIEVRLQTINSWRMKEKFLNMFFFKYNSFKTMRKIFNA